MLPKLQHRLLAICCALVVVAVARRSEADEEASQHGFRLPEGFVVERVAAPPLVRYPLFVSLDDRGRMYVAEGTGTNLPGAELANKFLGRILLLEDVDGDGRFDTSRVFADKLVFPQGVLWHDGAVYTASHPSIWRLEDTDDDGIADRREELLTGFKFNGNGCDIHGPFLGPDGRLYWTDGRHGYQCQTRDGRKLEGLASRVWRCRTDGRDVERLCGGGFDNPVELVWLPGGDLIGNMDQGQGDALLHYVEGAVFPMEHPCLNEFVTTGPLLGSMKQYSAALPAGLCGLGGYRSTCFGDEYRDSVFTTYYVQHKIARYTISRDGSTYRAEDVDFLTTDNHDVRLTDVEEDADGSLLIVDMGAWFSYGFPGNPLPKPEVLGAIYRIRRKNATVPVDPWGKNLDLTRRSTGQLAELLDDPRPRVRDQAVARLAKAGDDAAPVLSSVLRDPARSVESRRGAVWALCRVERAASLAAVRAALSDADPTVRQAAVHVVGLHRDRVALAELTAMLEREEAPLRLTVAEALGRIGRGEAVPALLAALARGGDRFLEHALVYALIRINDRDRTVAGLRDANPRVRRGALVALDQMTDGRLSREEAAPLLDTDDPVLQQAVLDCMSRHEGWAADTIKVLRELIVAPARSTDQARSLTGALLAFSSDEKVQRLTAELFSSAEVDGPTRLLLLQVLARCQAQAFPRLWLNMLDRALADRDGAIQLSALQVIKLRRLDEFDSRLEQMSQGSALSPEIRIAALECLAGRRQNLDADSFNLLARQLAENVEPLLRIAAARTLASGALSADQLIGLADRLASTNAMTARMLLPVFARSSDRRVGEALALALDSSSAADALSLAEVDAAFRGFPSAVRARVEPLRSRLEKRYRQQADYLAGLKSSLGQKEGSAAAGRGVFFSQRAGCYACHRVGGSGGAIGPELSQIGRFRTSDELLESIVFPSLVVVPEFRSCTIATSQGITLTGLVIRETPESLELRTADLSEVRVPRDHIGALEPAAVSLMPDGLEKTVSPQELADLVRFLSELR
jgi:putative heme-binding domain-containing protein